MLDEQNNCHNITKRKHIHKDELNHYLEEGWSLIKVTVGEERPYTIGWDETRR
ncbi:MULTISPECIES: hypothetical protein [unclassified Bacillus (in: firmicutes)]|jgi:hypothetical protein|uniref:hypothetical protein n=1 Tax=unclassified Bacillus (in: firmicutes) TaxID=185979 RepID=UPI000B217AF4|nr:MULTISPECIES: hypothetical protein [unclassified Bacillus (in: firmicutes)]